MRYLSLFSGIEAASVAWVPLGWECVGVAEIEKSPCAVLAHHYPGVPNLGDITKITQEQIAALGRVDLVVGGFPCQDVSVAGKRAGLENEDGTTTRSGLFFTALQLADWSGARWVVVENVPGLFSSKQGRDFAAVVGALAGCEFSIPPEGWKNMGAAAGPNGLVEWSVLDAQWAGVPQRRRRVFLVRDSGDWASRPPVLFERHSLQGHPPPSREARQGVAGTTQARTFECGGIGSYSSSSSSSPLLKSGADLGHGCEALIHCADVAHATTHQAKGGDPTTDNYVAHSLRGEGFDASEDGTGRGTPLVPTYCIKGAAIGRKPEAGPQYGEVVEDVSYTQNGGGHQAVAFALQDDTTPKGSLELNGALRRDAGGEGACVAIQPDTCYNKGIDRGANHASTQEGNAGTLLSRVQKEIGAQAFAEWGLGILDSLQHPEVLRQALHGSELRPTTFSRRWVVYCTLSREEDRASGAMLSLLEACGERCPSQGWEPLEQLAGQLGAYLSGLSQPGAQAEKFMRDLWIADEGAGVLREALSAIQEARRPAAREGQPAHAAMQVRRLTPECCEFLQGFPRGYTSVPFTHGKPAADGPRYKALGNSMAVPVMSWIGQRIQLVDWLHGND